jgi:hypothetical protein
MHVLGIDAGGTKTVCLLADGNGTVLTEVRGAGANLQASGELEVEKVLHDVMERALSDYDVRPDAICLGIAGVDRPRDAEAIRSVMRRIGFKTRILVVNDALVARAKSLGLTYEPDRFPVMFWDLFGEQGHPIRATISEMGPLLLSRLMQGLLFGVAPSDPVTLMSVAMILAAASIAACLVPAFRASRVDPSVALRSD